MNVFQQVFADVSPHACDLVAKEGHRSPPIKIKMNEVAVYENKKTKNAASSRKEIHNGPPNNSTFIKKAATSINPITLKERPSCIKIGRAHV